MPSCCALENSFCEHSALLGNAQLSCSLTGVARAVYTTAQEHETVHPFLWGSCNVPCGPTSITNVRRVCIDYILYQPDMLQMLEAPVSAQVDGVIPNLIHPSDHLPIRARYMPAPMVTLLCKYHICAYTCTE